MSQAARKLREAVVARARDGAGRSNPAVRRAAFDNAHVDPRVRPFVDKVTRHAWKITGADVDTARAAGLSEDEIFEVTICAALGQATRQLGAALAALDQAQGSDRKRS
jgi:alkylhydroperoxidase family enzyme